ncbi:IS5 family transposase [Pseudoroseomonas sp. WGS1072]|uniref:IS5 family transposase n=1 Tax=Roseomonas sp. WGS1072 TaxID=3366816 RepID=UPI003BF0523F
MTELFWLTDAQMERLKPFFPLSHGRPRVDDRRVLSGIIFVNRNGLRWRDAPPAYGPPKTLYNRWVRWSRMGIFARMLKVLAEQACDPSTVMIDATHLKAHRTAASLRGKKGAAGRLIGRTKGGLNSKLHALADAKGRPLNLYLSAGPTSDYIGARALLPSMPKAQVLLADRGYDADWFRDALAQRDIVACIPGRQTRKILITHNAALYRQRHKIENAFARLKDWRRVATRYDRCDDIFLSACALAAMVIFWL